MEFGKKDMEKVRFPRTAEEKKYHPYIVSIGASIPILRKSNSIKIVPLKCFLEDYYCQ